MENRFTESLWGDEGFSAILSMKPPLEIIRIIINDTSPPLYNLTEHLAFRIFGTEEVVVRGLSFFYYCLAIFFVYKIGAFLWDRKTGLAAAALSFFNPFFFIYAFEGRMYSILALGVTASMYFFLRVINEEKIDKRKKNQPNYTFNRFGYVIATLWALYSHHFAIFGVMLQGLWFIYEFIFGRRKNAFTIFKLLIITGLLYTPWLYPLYNQTKMVGGGFWLATPDLTELRKLTFDYLALGQRNRPLDVFALYGVFGLLIIRHWEKRIKKSIFVLTMFIFPILATYIISQYFTSVFFNRYLLYAIPGAMLLIASNRRKLVSGVLIGLVLGLFIKLDYEYFYTPTKRPFKDLAAYVQETKRGDDYLIIWDPGNHQLWETKYYDIPAPIYAPEGQDLPFFVGTALMEPGDIVNDLPPKAFRIGVVTIGDIEDVNITGYPIKNARDFGNGLKFVWLEK